MNEKNNLQQRTGNDVSNMFPKLCAAHCFFFCSMMAGCATSASVVWDKAVQQTKSGQCADALRTIDSMDVEFKKKLFLKSYVYGDCRGKDRDMNKAWDYLTLAARYGETMMLGHYCPVDFRINSIGYQDRGHQYSVAHP